MAGENDKLWVVGIGSSAGGLEALQAFVTNLPKDVPAAIIIAQHLAPHAKSMLVELLARHSTIPVSVANNGEKLRGSRIYIVPPNHDIDLNDGRLFLHLAGEETRPKPSVDTLFESLARTWGEQAVGIVLSGTGTDGTQGIQAIQAAGGLTLAQDDFTARYDGMPKSAVESGSVSAILPPDVMARDLVLLFTEHGRKRNQKDSAETEWINEILELLRQQIGMNFTQYKMPTIRRRIEKHMRAARQASPHEYLTHLKEHPEAIQELSQELLISVTSFFRDGLVFDVLRKHAEDLISQRQDQAEFRVWVAGCATGEEAYTVAMVLTRALQKLGAALRLKVFATDLDQEALIQARSGIYSAEDIESVPEEYREAYFRRRGEQFEVDKTLRDCVVFARQDLGQSAPFVKMDIITCRNVLIYFGPPLQKRIFELFHYALNPGGLLFLGKSESVSEAVNLFEMIDRKVKIYRKLNVVSRVFPSNNYISQSTTQTPRRNIAPISPLAEMAQKEILARYEVCGVVIDEHFSLMHVIGNIGHFVKYPEGQATLNITQILPKGAGAEIPVVIKKVQKTGEPQRTRAYALAHSKKDSFFINVRPMASTEGSAPRLFLLLFESQRKAKPKQAVAAHVVPDLDTGPRITELEQELSETKEHLQTVIEELGISNEELQSLNEELNSTNEELQSSNEELETTNEELQSTNEELTTLNEELANKSNELRHTNLNLENIQNSIASPMVVVDIEMRVLRFNLQANKIFDISPSDMGRNVTRLSAHAEIPNFHDLISKTLDTGRVGEARVERFETLYQMRVLPSYDENKRIVGAVLIFFDNSALIRTEERLRLSEERIRAILNSSPSMISLKDSLGRYLVVNKAFCEFWGRSQEELVGKTDRELFDAEMAARLRDADLEVLYKKVHTGREEELKPGSTFTTVRFPLFQERSSQPYAVGMVAVDVSERVRIQQELTRSESRYRSIVEDQAVFVCRFDPKFRILFVNNTFSDYFGGSPESYRDRDFLNMMDGADRVRVEAELSRIGTQSPVVHLEHQVARFGNDIRWVRWIMKAVTDTSGHIVEVQGVGFDVTEYRTEADRLQEREAIFSHIFSYTTDYLTVFRVMPGPEFIVESFNPSAEQAMGYSFTHLLGRNLRTLMDEAKYKTFLERFNECLQTRKPGVLEEEMPTPGGTKYLSTTLVPIVNLQGRVERVASMSRDVSNFKHIQDELRAEKERAETASRSKSDFLASMSHELRTPLNVMLGMAQLLADAKLPAEEHRYVGTIQRSGQVLLSLIEDILDLSKVEEGQMRLESVPFNLRDLVAEVSDSFQNSAATKDLIFKCKVAEHTPAWVVGDPGRIRQVLVNLVSNAIKFTDSGSVIVRIESVAGSSSSEPQFRFSVIDTGIGIKDDQHDRLFQKFSQADSGLSRRFGGTGLGLAICKRIVELMGGEIGFESSFGKGSTFWFKIRLPVTECVREVEGTLATNGAPPATEPTRALNVLAVEDNLDTQVFIQLLLKGMGHSVVTASAGREALSKVKKQKFDVVLMDVQMPELDGYETTRLIRQLPAPVGQLPIIALTANAMNGDAQKCLQAGMNDYLSKPVQKDALRNALKKWSHHLAT